MKKFLIQLLIFITPLIILFGLPTYILWQSKENFHKLENVLSSKEKYLIGYAYQDNNFGFLKWTYLNSHAKKCVWALGSSRVLQFRENMFDSSFYNAGFTISNITDFKPFLKSLPNSKRPKYIIIGLDQWMFNEAYDDLNSIPSTESWKNSFTLYPKLFPTYSMVYSDLFVGKYTFSSFAQNQNSQTKIGLNAKINNTGFRNDGSMYYGIQIAKLMNKDTTANDFNYSNTFERIKQGINRFQYCKSINKKAVSELNYFLKYCKNNKIEVIAFLPPYADKVYNKMIKSGNYDYLTEIYSRLRPIFDENNSEIYDFSTMTSCNSNDVEAIDGFHGSEVTYQKILISILESGSVLNNIANIKRLKNDLKKKKNNYLIYEY